MTTHPWRVACDSPELAVEVARLAQEFQVPVAPEPTEQPFDRAAEILAAGNSAGVAVSGAWDEPEAPTAAKLVRLALAARAAKQRAVACLLGTAPDLLDLAGDVGVVAVDDVPPLLSALALLSADAERPWTASTRELAAPDRVRMQGATSEGRRGGYLGSAESGRLTWTAERGLPGVLVGRPAEARAALLSLRAADGPVARRATIVHGADLNQVRDVIFGPRRALSDPTSKAALGPYGLTLAPEELCATPSRVAAEAARMGFPVRIALASPDLRVWNHPELAVESIESATAAKDAFRQIMALARGRSPEARLLGVSVATAHASHGMLKVRLAPLPNHMVFCELGFADPHGVAAADRACTVLPAPPARIEKVLRRLRGAALVLRGTAAAQKAVVASVSDALLRLAAFIDDWREEVTSVEVNPLACLIGGEVEVREACVTVSDAFERTLRPAAAY